jgi:hypothetical protein
MPSVALSQWQTNQTSRLDEIEAHCVSVAAQVPPNLIFFEECLRGYVLHLSAHFQRFCRDLYTECSQLWIDAIPAGMQATAQVQCASRLSLDRGNPTYEHIKQDFNRFGFLLDRRLAVNPANAQRITDLGHLNAWRNRAAHQGTGPLGGGVSASAFARRGAEVENLMRWTGEIRSMI